jgi:hypothetical protein
MGVSLREKTDREREVSFECVCVFEREREIACM